jgi:hypothetical protein
MIKFDFIRFGATTKHGAEKKAEGAPVQAVENEPPMSSPTPEAVEWASLPPTRPRRRFAEQPLIGWQSESERHDVTRCILEGVRAGSALPFELYLRYSTTVVVKERGHSARAPETNRSWLAQASERAPAGGEMAARSNAYGSGSQRISAAISDRRRMAQKSDERRDDRDAPVSSRQL